MARILAKMAVPLLAALLLSSTFQLSHAQGSWLSGTARLIVADANPNNTGLVAVDLPSFNVTHRLGLPGAVESMGMTLNNEYAGVFRARGGNDQNFLTFVHTGLNTLPSLFGSTNQTRLVPGQLRRMSITKTLLLVNGSDAIGGVEDGATLVFHPRWRTHLMYAENHGLVIGYDAAVSANPNSAVRVTFNATIPQGHFHLTPVLDYTLAPHTTGNLALILARNGSIVRQYECGACHGSEMYEISEVQAVGLFGCNTTVIAVVIDTSGPVPTFTNITLAAADPRIGSFTPGAPGVFWTAGQGRVNITSPETTPGSPFFYRTDVRTVTAPAITRVDHPGSGLGFRGQVIRALGVPAQSRMVAMHRVGLLVMYDGVTGAALSNVTVAATGIPLTATAPFLALGGSTVYVSVPHTGEVHEIQCNFSMGTMNVTRTVQLPTGVIPGAMLVAAQAALISA